MQEQITHLLKHNLDDILLGNKPETELKLLFSHWRSCEKCRQSLIERKKMSSTFSETEIPDVIYELTQPDALFCIFGSKDKILMIQFFPDKLIPKQISSLNIPVIKENLPEYLVEAGQQLADYFDNGRPVTKIPFSNFFIKSEFAKSVLFWTSLVPFGETVTYGEIAAWMDKPKSARAVGGALHNNPLPVIIPCHRVLGSKGKLIGFAGGLNLKSRMLELEKILMK